MPTTLSDLSYDMKRKISEYLSGPELACLNYVSQGFNDFCYEIKFYEKFKEIDVLQIIDYFKMNGFHPLNLIFNTRPICSTRYPNPEELSESDNKSLNIDDFCYGSIFKHEGKNYCEGCMTERYGEGWKSWEYLPRIAKRTNHFLTVRGIIVYQKKRVYGPTHYREDGVEVDLDDEPVVSKRYWLKDQDDLSIWNLEEDDIRYDVVFNGPTTPWLDDFVQTEHARIDTNTLEEKQKKRYIEECLISGKQVGRLYLPFVYDEGGYEDLYCAKLFVNSFEFKINDLEVLI